MIEERQYKEDVLKGRFAKSVLQKQGREIKIAQEEVMSRNSFKNVPTLPRTYRANEDKLSINFTNTLRFIDMRTRKTEDGSKRKKSYPIYNRIIFGHLNNIIKELSFGFTESVKESFKSLEKD